MADDNDDEDKTEEPTEKRLADAIERGNTPVSREVSFVTSLAAYLLIEIYVLPSTTPGLVAALVHFIDDPSGWLFDTGGDAMMLANADRSVTTSIFLMIWGAVASFLAFRVGDTKRPQFTGTGIVLTARLVYGMASYRALPETLARVSVRLRTPVAASAEASTTFPPTHDT